MTEFLRHATEGQILYLILVSLALVVATSSVIFLPITTKLGDVEKAINKLGKALSDEKQRRTPHE